jgi:integrase
MSIIRLTKRTISSLAPAVQPYVAYDEDLPGFGLRVMPSGKKTWIVEYRPGPGGRKVYIRRMKIELANRITPDEARTRAKEILARVRLGEDPAGARKAARQIPTVAEFVEQFLKEATSPPHLKPATKRLYTDNLHRLVVPAIGSLKLDAVTSADVARLYRRIASTRPTTANNVLVTLSSLYRYAGEIGVVAKGVNPARNAVTRRKAEKKERFLSAEEIERLVGVLQEVERNGLDWRLNPNIDAAQSKHRARPENQEIEVSPFVVAAIRLLLLTGCRRGEILSLKWAEVDLEGGVLNLSDSKTGRKTVILNAPALTILSELPRAGCYVIAGPDPVAPRPDITRQWYRIRELAGLDGCDGRPAFRLHDFRHSFASIGVANGIGLPIVGKLLGHTQASTTHRYAHLDADPMRRAANAIGEIITASKIQRVLRSKTKLGEEGEGS